MQYIPQLVWIGKDRGYFIDANFAAKIHAHSPVCPERMRRMKTLRFSGAFPLVNLSPVRLFSFRHGMPACTKEIFAFFYMDSVIRQSQVRAHDKICIAFAEMGRIRVL